MKHKEVTWTTDADGKPVLEEIWVDDGPGRAIGKNIAPSRDTTNFRGGRLRRERPRKIRAFTHI